MILDSNTATLTQLREWMGEVIRNNSNGGRFWDLITCLRGPDSPSERSDMGPTAYQKTYDQRRARKRRTVEVIRGKAFFGAVGGSARSRDDINYVTLPPQKEWDHFDKHVQRAANVLGLSIRYLKGKKQRKIEAGEPEWEVLMEGKANGVVVKKPKKPLLPVPVVINKDASGKYSVSQPSFSGGALTLEYTEYFNEPLPKTWAKTPETLAEVIKKAAGMYEKTLDQTKEVLGGQALDPNDIPF